MPHYKDGTPAALGDIVKGKPYNTSHEIVGEVIQITPAADSCNCMVAFIEKIELPSEIIKHIHNLNLGIPYTTRVKGGIVDANKSSEMEYLKLIPKVDYGALRDFIKLN